MECDVIILSNGKAAELIEMTQTTINSLHDSETDHQFNVIVFEQNKVPEYKNAKTIHYDCDFHYNKLMNIGIRLTSNDWVCLANNDLLFQKNWFSECIKHDYLSMSPDHLPEKTGVKEGYRIGNDGELKGWCILTQRKLFDIIGSIDESVNFWYSDNVYADQLKEKGLKHALIKDACVIHLDGKTLKTMSEKDRIEYCDKQKEIYAPKVLQPNWEIK